MSTYNLLKLHFAQAKQALYKASNNCYADYRKQMYQDRLQDLFEKLSEDIPLAEKLSDSDIYDKYTPILHFIFKSLEFLDSSTLNQIPYEIVECLNFAMHDWLDPTDNYIIVTSLNNNIEEFSFDPSIAFNDALYLELQARYSINFSHRLVQINLPRGTSRDYLSAVVLYHELGHFIDMKYSLMTRLSRVLIDQISFGKIVGAELMQLLIYFPHLSTIVGSNVSISSFNDVFEKTKFHLQEYFCDLFAAQYIGESSNYYLTYLTKGNSTAFYTHPATTDRVRVVKNFLSGTPDIVVRLCDEVVNAIKKRHLNILHDDIDNTDFFDLIPLELTSVRQLHGIFPCAWNIWLNNQGDLLKALNAKAPSTMKLYNVINNIVEKSIGNYITINRWNKAKQTI